MSIAARILRRQHMAEPGSRLGLALKVAFALYVTASYFVGSRELDVANALAGMILLAASGCADIALYSLIIYAPVTALMVLVSMLLGGFSSSTLHNYLYGYATFLAVAFLASTTHPSDLAALADRLGLGLAVRMLNNVLWELEEAVASKASRGFEPGLNPKKQLVVVLDAVKIAAKRASEIEAALRSRGVE